LSEFAQEEPGPAQPDSNTATHNHTTACGHQHAPDMDRQTGTRLLLPMGLSFAIVVFILKNCWGIAKEAGLNGVLRDRPPRAAVRDRSLRRRRSSMSALLRQWL
jgi:hypothetical protein